MTSNNYITTKKGTKLPLLNLRGKKYLQVAQRLVWFREEHPDWSITTKVAAHNEEELKVLMRVEVRDEKERIIATAHKTESRKTFPDYIEKAETGAVGRALALIGYGTQYEPELDEGGRVVDGLQKPTTYPNKPTKKPVKVMTKEEIEKAVGKKTGIEAARAARNKLT